MSGPCNHRRPIMDPNRPPVPQMPNGSNARLSDLLRRAWAHFRRPAASKSAAGRERAAAEAERIDRLRNPAKYRFR